MTLNFKIFAVSLAALGLAPLMASAEQADASELDLFQSAKISAQTAGQTALSAHPGTLAEVQFNDENGTGIFEALVVDTGGTTWMVKVDANTGLVLAQGQANLMNDDDKNHEVGDNNGGDNDNGGEADEDGNG